MPIPLFVKKSIKIFARSALVSLCSAAALGFVGTPGATALSSARVPMATAASGQSYTVVKGDSLIGIATRAKVTLGALLKVNNFTKTSVIQPGQVIKLPEGAVTPSSGAAAPTASTYTVAKGDSLIGIATRAKVTLGALLKVNNFTKTSVIQPGQVIKLPDGATAPATAATAVTATSSTTVQAPAAGAPEKLQSYTVQAGDSLTRIAAKAKVTLEALLQANGFSKSSVIHPGQVIDLPIGAATPSTRVQEMIAFAMAQIGKPYLFGSAGPNSYDCSGLVRASFAKVGVNVPHQSRLLATMGAAVDWKNSSIQPGDLIFTYSGGNTSQIGHVAIAISSTEMVEALSPGKTVSTRKIPAKDRIIEVRRIL